MATGALGQRLLTHYKSISEQFDSLLLKSISIASDTRTFRNACSVAGDVVAVSGCCDLQLLCQRKG